MGKKVEKEDFIKRIEKSHPFSKIEIIEFNGLKNPLTFKCSRCGKVITLKRAEAIFSKINICDCKKDFYSREQKIKFFESRQNDLKVIEIGKVKSKIQCLKCGQIFERTTVSLMTSFENCPNCNNSITKQTNTISEAEAYLKKFFPYHNYKIKKYINFHSNCEIEHLDCHFTYKGRFDSFINSRGCPRCYRKISKGEQDIKKYLEENNIDFIQQKSLNLEEKMKRYKFDFYLPKFNLAIEYQGEQHYINKQYFDNLSITQERDRKKQEYCKKYNINLLIIPYTEKKLIPNILSSKLNDYRKS